MFVLAISQKAVNNWSAPLPFVLFFASVLVGYLVAFLNLFLHEAAHYGLASKIWKNDILGWLAVGWIVGTNIQTYRKGHWRHHLRLGKTDDPENSYFSNLDGLTIAKALFGIKALQKIFSPTHQTETTSSLIGAKLPILVGLLNHAILILVFVLMNAWTALSIWILGLAFFFPFFAWLRQLLEHRSETSQSSIDYTKTDHGAVARIFGSGPVSSTFGGAGFNRHLLHHWDATISCTRLSDVENFLLQSNLRESVLSSKTSYLKTVSTLLRQR